MALENRIESLKKQHADLDHMLRIQMTHPGVDDFELHRLKSRKLALKDEIERLLHDNRQAA